MEREARHEAHLALGAESEALEAAQRAQEALDVEKKKLEQAPPFMPLNRVPGMETRPAFREPVRQEKALANLP